MLIDRGDLNWCPSLVEVHVGDSPLGLKLHETVNLSPRGMERCVLFSQQSLTHRIVQVKIKENNGGCDCKVHGIFLRGYIASHAQTDLVPDSAKLSSMHLVEKVLDGALKEPVCVRRLSQFARLKLICQLTMQQARPWRRKLMQQLVRVIQRVTLPPAMSLCFAPIMQGYVERLNGDRTNQDRESSLEDLSFLEFSMIANRLAPRLAAPSIESSRCHQGRDWTLLGQCYLVAPARPLLFSTAFHLPPTPSSTDCARINTACHVWTPTSQGADFGESAPAPKSAGTNASLRWDTTVTSYEEGMISEDRRNIVCRGSAFSVRADRGFRAGTHVWRVKVFGSSSGIRLGVVTASFDVWKSSGHAIGNHPKDDEAFGFWSGNPCGAWKTGQAPTFSGGDTIKLTLDLTEMTLTAQNLTTSSPAITVCKSLPRDVDLFLAASVYTGVANSVELLDTDELPGSAALPEAGRAVIVVAGGNVCSVKCSGRYLQCGERGGALCYSRDGGGSLYYDGKHWKLCQAGNGTGETGWNFSQAGPKEQVPLGKWDASLRQKLEVKIDYTSLTLSAASPEGGASPPHVDAGGTAEAAPAYMAITRMQQYEAYSFEELRVGDYVSGRKVRADCFAGDAPSDPAGSIQAAEAPSLEGAERAGCDGSFTARAASACSSSTFERERCDVPDEHSVEEDGARSERSEHAENSEETEDSVDGGGSGEEGRENSDLPDLDVEGEAEEDEDEDEDDEEDEEDEEEDEDEEESDADEDEDEEEDTDEVEESHPGVTCDGYGRRV